MVKSNQTSSSNASQAGPADYIEPLNINGLEGRMLRLPPPPNEDKEILFVYGHHSSLERWWGVMQVLNRHAGVTMPDLPGFGGMDSFYKIGRQPTIDNLADYLATFVKMRYKRKKVIIAGMSYGFVVATRMLQRYPELTKKVTLLVSIVGFAHHDDFTFGRLRYYTYLYGSRFFSYRLSAGFFRHTALNTFLLRTFYARTHNAKNKFKNAHTKEEFDHLMDVEVGLWHDNDVRTYMFTTAEFLVFDNCQVKVDLPVWHVSAEVDHFFDNTLVEQHMRVIFSDYHACMSDMKNHAPSVIATEEEAAPLIPAKLRQVLKNL